MDMAGIAISANSGTLQQAVQVSVLKKAMDGDAAQSAKLIEAMTESAPVKPSFGHKLDIRA